MNVIPLPEKNSSAASSEPNNSTSPAAKEETYTARHFPRPRPPVPAAPYIGGVEWDATTYLTAHLDLLNGLLASLSTALERNTLRSELHASGFEKCMSTTLRTCKEKFYGGVHDGLRVWVAAGVEDGWEVRDVRFGVVGEGRGAGKVRNGGPPAPKLELPRLEVSGVGGAGGGEGAEAKMEKEEDEGWLG